MHDLGVLLTLALEAFKERLHAHLARAGYDDLGPSFGTSSVSTMPRTGAFVVSL